MGSASVVTFPRKVVLRPSLLVGRPRIVHAIGYDELIARLYSLRGFGCANHVVCYDGTSGQPNLGAVL